jgi:hypothetical protein
MLSKRLQDLARSIDRARRTSSHPDYLLGIYYAAHAIADDSCTAGDRYHFFLMCGVPFTL